MWSSLHIACLQELNSYNNLMEVQDLHVLADQFYKEDLDFDGLNFEVADCLQQGEDIRSESATTACAALSWWYNACSRATLPVGKSLEAYASTQLRASHWQLVLTVWQHARRKAWSFVELAAGLRCPDQVLNQF